MKEKTAYLLLGSNVGDRLQNLSSALYALSALGRIEKTSTIYETEAWGYEDQANFLNQAISLKTSFSPTDLLLKIKGIEEQLGRDEAKKWHPRIIDIDILAFNQDVLQSPELTLPHPQMEMRNFAMIPLMEIAPEWIHPILKKSVEELYDNSPDLKEVYIFSGE